MPTRKPVAKPGKQIKPSATAKVARRKPVARLTETRSTATKAKSSVTKSPVRKAAPAAKLAVVKAPAARAPAAKLAVVKAPVVKALAAKAPAAKVAVVKAPVVKASAAKSQVVVAEPVPVAPPAATPLASTTKAKAVTKSTPAARASSDVVTAVAVRTSNSEANGKADGRLTGAASFETSAPNAADGDDGEEGHNLLAGPRNVQPYIVTRGEQYMNKEQTEHFRDILLAWKRDLMVEVDRTVSHMKDEAANFPDPNDRATQEEEFSLELRTRDRERKLIRKIDEAIKRIEDGSYGYCLETGEEIGIKRLEARPVATLSLEAQERRERREKQYGDRDDRYR